MRFDAINTTQAYELNQRCDEPRQNTYMRRHKEETRSNTLQRPSKSTMKSLSSSTLSTELIL